VSRRETNACESSRERLVDLEVLGDHAAVGRGVRRGVHRRLTHDDGAVHDLVVEFEAPSALASVGYAEEIARSFLRTADTPRHVIVDIRRDVRVLGEG
jgi:hypothetical protein